MMVEGSGNNSTYLPGSEWRLNESIWENTDTVVVFSEIHLGSFLIVLHYPGTGKEIETQYSVYLLAL